MKRLLVLKRDIWLLAVALHYFAIPVAQAQTASLNRLDIKSPQALKQFFTYTPDRIPFISAHRGGARSGYPENCLATFENTLRYTPAMMEVDPRYTKDGVIVLLHDPTLERTTNGKGQVADHTWAELQQLRLKDTQGKLTDYKIPTLDEALEWARGKTILILDKKDVPLEVRVRKIQDHKAEAYALVMAYNFEEARQCYQLSKDIMMEVFVPSREKLTEYEKTGVPWENSVVFIAHAKAQDKALYGLLHQKGVMCIIGSSRIYDKAFTQGKTGVYEDIIADGADIIEADLAIEAGQGIKKLLPRKSAKDRFFVRADTRKEHP
jgi:glycerophosphoryl diester phosphodiesterase